jgi:S-adenosylmethionine-diacylglycerol 3-amino-3-carboxypropyl transferase
VLWARDSILFSSCNEDTACELRALGDLAGKRVFAVTAGGGRVLNLLVGRPAEIVAVDLNPAQNHLLELKMAGLRALDHASYLRFLGVRPAADRAATYQRLRGALSAAARAFFDAHPDLIERGVLLEGKLERYLRRVAAALRVLHPLGISRLFSFDDLEEQRRFVDRLDRPRFRAVAQLACRRTMLRLFSGDPGFYRHVPAEVSLHRAIYGGVMEHFRHRLARDNPLMQLVFFGRWIREEALPIYLNAATFDQVKTALETTRVVQVTSLVGEALASSREAPFDAFSLSDISSYLDDAQHARLFDDVLAAARPGARICSRSNIHHRPLTAAQAARIARDRALEDELAIADHSCVHRFVVGGVA